MVVRESLTYTRGHDCATSNYGWLQEYRPLTFNVQNLVMKLCIILVLLFSVVGAAHSQASPDETVDRLAKVDVFAFGPVGYAGIISQGEKDYLSIQSRHSAAEDFERLFKIGNPAAKCYALVALRWLNPRRFAELAASLHNSEEKVTIAEGCLISHERLSKLVAGIETGSYGSQPLSPLDAPVQPPVRG